MALIFNLTGRVHRAHRLMKQWCAWRTLLVILLLPMTCLADESRCTEFKWVTDIDGAEKSAMVVTVTINGHSTDLQFDTGSDVSVLYGEEQAKKLGLQLQQQDGGEKTATASLNTGRIELTSQTFFIAPYPPAAVAGRIGMKSLLGSIVQIDYPNNQICLLNTLEYLSVRGDIQQVPAKIRSNRLFLTTQVNQQQEKEFIFDTGASLYPLLLDRESWRQFTGRQGSEPDNTRIQGWANDKLVTTIGAPLKGQIQLGELTVSTPEAHYIMEHPNYFSKRALPSAGLLGNALFFKRKVILDLRHKYTWFGISKKEVAGG